MRCTPSATFSGSALRATSWRRSCAKSAASRGSPASKGRGKRAYYETIELDVETAYAHACEVMATSAVTEDGREMMRAFLEKRTAVYPPRR